MSRVDLVYREISAIYSEFRRFFVQTIFYRHFVKADLFYEIVFFETYGMKFVEIPHVIAKNYGIRQIQTVAHRCDNVRKVFRFELVVECKSFVYNRFIFLIVLSQILYI